MNTFDWNESRTKAALALAEGQTHAEVAKQCQVSRTTIYNWLSHPIFRAEVDKLTLVIGIATRAERLRLAQRVVRQKTRDDGTLDTKADVLDWLKFAQSETDGSKNDLTEQLARAIRRPD